MNKQSLAVVVLFVASLLAPTSLLASTTVALSGYSPGTIIVKTHQRHLYYVISDGRAIRYPVGVGRAGMTWTGEAYIAGKYIRPAWSPPEMIRRFPSQDLRLQNNWLD